MVVIKKTTKNCFIPITVGGGVSSLEDINNLLLSGADKVSINTAAVKDMNLIKDGDLDYIVEQRTDLAFRFGADGVICSPEEIKLLRKNYKDKLIVTPGIRNKQDDAGDQKRIATRSQAFTNGADYVVVGRPVYKAHNPLEALRNL